MNTDLTHDEWRRANESLAAARVCLDNELNADSISRSYYAVFHAASAALHTLGVIPGNHRGVRIQFGLHIARPGLVEGNWGSQIGNLHALRNSADYHVVRRFSEFDARDAYDRAEAFVNRMRPLVQR